MTTTRRSTLAAIGGIGALAAVGPVLGVGDHEDDERDNETDGANGEEPAPTAAVRIAHFSPDAPNVDVYVDDEQVLANVAYDTISPYLEIAPGSYQVRITAAGDSETVVFDEEVPVSRAFYTIAAIGELEADTFRALVLTDAGSALIRLAHVSPDAPAVDVVGSEGAPTLFENVAFGETTNYVALPAGTYSLDVRPAAGDGGDEAGGTAPETSESGAADSNETEGLDDETDEASDADEAIATVEVTLKSGTAYTAFATGYLEAEPPFAVRLDIDGSEAADEPIDEPVDDDVDDPDEPTDDADDDFDDGADDDVNDTDDDTMDDDDMDDDTDSDDYNDNEIDDYDDNDTDDYDGNDTDNDTGFSDDTDDHNDTDDFDDNDTDDDC